MSQHDYVIGNDTAANVRADINTALLAIASNNSGASAPATTYANQWWYDSTNDILKIRAEANDAWISVAKLNQTSDQFFPIVGGVEVTATGTEINKLAGLTATAVELGYVTGVTSAIQTQLGAKAALASPALTGVPTAPTAANGTNTTQIATTAYVTANGGAVYYSQDTEPTSPPNASIWYQPSYDATYIRSNSIWLGLNVSFGPASDRGIFGGNPYDYISVSTLGNASLFGTTSGYNRAAGASNGTRGLHGGGLIGATSYSAILYITIAVQQDAQTFGNLTVARIGLTGISNITRGVFIGGESSTVMDYVTIATTGNATSFGTLAAARYLTAGLSNATRGVFGGGTTSATTLEYITVATTGSATSFGTIGSRYAGAGISNATRGVIGGGVSGGSPTATMEYVTIATAANATTFGNLTVARNSLAGVQNATRGVFGGGNTGSVSAVMDYITVATTGNATTFGNLVTAREFMAGVSGYIPT